MDKKIILKIIDLSGQTLKYDITSLRDKNNEEISNYVHNKLEEREPFYSKAQMSINPLEEDITSILK